MWLAGATAFLNGSSWGTFTTLGLGPHLLSFDSLILAIPRVSQRSLILGTKLAKQCFPLLFLLDGATFVPRKGA
jgi:hypothetical protein